MKLLLIGDIHCNFPAYEKILDKNKNNYDLSIQLGDFGFKDTHDKFIERIDSTKNRILFGNHDYYPYLDLPYSLGNFYYNETANLFAIRGADSIDKEIRTIGLDWFENEQLSYMDLVSITNLVIKLKPQIIVTHQCPVDIQDMLTMSSAKCRTSQALQSLFDSYKPKYWVFGHHHRRFTAIIDNTEFICLDSLEYININTNLR